MPNTVFVAVLFTAVPHSHKHLTLITTLTQSCLSTYKLIHAYTHAPFISPFYHCLGFIWTFLTFEQFGHLKLCI